MITVIRRSNVIKINVQKRSFLFAFFIFHGIFLNFFVKIVIFQQYFSQKQQIKGRPKILLDLNISILSLHQHEIAQSILIGSPDKQINVMRNQQIIEYFNLFLRIIQRLFLIFAFGNSLVDFVNTVIGKTNKQGHFCIIFCTLFQLCKFLTNVWKLLFQSTIDITSDDNFNVVFCDYFEDVVLLVNLRQALKLLTGQVHQKLQLFRLPIEILKRKCIKRCIFDSQLQTIEQTFFQCLRSFHMTGQIVSFFAFGEPPISIHNKGNMFWNFALLEYLNGNFLKASQLQHDDVSIIFNLQGHLHR